MRCMLSGAPAFESVLIRAGAAAGSERQFLAIEFNHIRQRANFTTRAAGISVDSSGMPSGIIREILLDRGDERAKRRLLEMMCVIPITKTQHGCITAQSQKSHITLTNFHRREWPWAIRNRRNFREICKEFDIRGVEYYQLIAHLRDVDAPPLNARLTYLPSGRFRWS